MKLKDYYQQIDFTKEDSYYFQEQKIKWRYSIIF